MKKVYLRDYKKILKVLKYIKLKRAIIFRAIMLLLFFFFTLKYLGIPDKYDRVIYYAIYILLSINITHYVYLWYHDHIHRKKAKKKKEEVEKNSITTF